MPFHLTTDGSITEIPTDNGQRANAEKAVLTTKDEWEAIAGAWSLKRLVEIWNALPGVTPVEKFTNRQIALERIWRAVESPEQARGRTMEVLGLGFAFVIGTTFRDLRMAHPRLIYRAGIQSFPSKTFLVVP